MVDCILTASEFDQKLGGFLARWSRIGERNIETFALRFCEQFGVNELPRDPRWHFREWGIVLKDGLTEGGERAAWMRLGDTYTITAQFSIDPQLSFVLWHEFFEILREHPSYPMSSRQMTTAHTERLANKFASHVLMPREVVKQLATELGHPDLDKTPNLAARFGVSLSAMRTTLRELGLSPRRTLTARRFY